MADINLRGKILHAIRDAAPTEVAELPYAIGRCLAAAKKVCEEDRKALTWVEFAKELGLREPERGGKQLAFALAAFADPRTDSRATFLPDESIDGVAAFLGVRTAPLASLCGLARAVHEASRKQSGDQEERSAAIVALVELTVRELQLDASEGFARAFLVPRCPWGPPEQVTEYLSRLFRSDGPAPIATSGSHFDDDSRLVIDLVKGGAVVDDHTPRDPAAVFTAGSVPLALVESGRTSRVGDHPGFETALRAIFSAKAARPGAPVTLTADSVFALPLLFDVSRLPDREDSDELLRAAMLALGPNPSPELHSLCADALRVRGPHPIPLCCILSANGITESDATTFVTRIVNLTIRFDGHPIFLLLSRSDLVALRDELPRLLRLPEPVRFYGFGPPRKFAQAPRQSRYLIASRRALRIGIEESSFSNSLKRAIDIASHPAAHSSDGVQPDPLPPGLEIDLIRSSYHVIGKLASNPESDFVDAVIAPHPSFLKMLPTDPSWCPNEHSPTLQTIMQEFGCPLDGLRSVLNWTGSSLELAQHALPFQFPTCLLLMPLYGSVSMACFENVADPAGAIGPFPGASAFRKAVAARGDMMLMARPSPSATRSSPSLVPLYYQVAAWLLGHDIPMVSAEQTWLGEASRATALRQLTDLTRASKPELDWYSANYAFVKQFGHASSTESRQHAETHVSISDGRRFAPMIVFTDMVGDLLRELEKRTRDQNDRDELDNLYVGPVGFNGEPESVWTGTDMQPPSHAFIRPSVMTMHTLISKSKSKACQEDTHAFVTWYLSENTQRFIAEDSKQAPLLGKLRSQYIRRPRKNARSRTLRAACIAHEGMLLNQEAFYQEMARHDSTVRDDIGLSEAQYLRLDEIVRFFNGQRIDEH